MASSWFPEPRSCPAAEVTSIMVAKRKREFHLHAVRSLQTYLIVL